MHRRRRPLAALALSATIAAISACGSSAPAGSSGGNNAPADAHSAVKFAQCMRTNGVSDFPDPGADGRLTIDAVANGSSLDPNAPAFKQAIGACKDLEPAGFTGSQRSSGQQQAALKFAKCVRDAGVKDFPDPLPNGPVIDTGRIPSAAGPGGISILNAAAAKCGEIAAAAGVTR